MESVKAVICYSADFRHCLVPCATQPSTASSSHLPRILSSAKTKPLVPTSAIYHLSNSILPNATLTRHCVPEMDHRKARRSFSRGQAEPYTISPQAARLSGGSLPGLETQGYWPAWDGASPRSRQPKHAGGTRREYDFEDFYENEEDESRRHPHNFSGGRHHDDEDIEALLGMRNSMGRRRHREDYNLDEDSVDTHYHEQARDRLQDRFEAYDPRLFQHDNARVRRPFGVVEEMSPYGAAGTHPSRHIPTSARNGDAPHGGNFPEDFERYVSSRLGGGHWDGDRDGKAREDANTRSNRTFVGMRGTQVDGHPQQQIGRFVPYTFQMLRRRDVDFLARIFRVRVSEIKRWCERDYIRMDRIRDCETNIDPLLAKLSSRDRENYASPIQRMEDKKGIDDPVGWGPRRVPAAYERGFDMGLASKLRESRGGGN